MNTHVTLPAELRSDSSCHWHANLALQFRRTAAGTRLVASRHEGPLYVQRPFYPEGRDMAHVYLLHPPGGLVSGDRLQITLELGTEAHVLCTTPGAGRVYRARSDRKLQEQLNHLQIESGASLEWFPQETILFPGAHTALETHVGLARGARFTGWEITVLGLPANSQRFDSGELRQRLRIEIAGVPVLLEQLWLDAASPLHSASCGLQGHAVSGLFVCGPFPATQLDEDALTGLRAVCARAPSRCGLTRIGDFFVGRYLGNCAQEARSCFVAWWSVLRPLLLQRPANLPAIWST